MTDASAKGVAGGGRAVVVTGPSGVGKSTILSRVREKTGAAFSISATTRAPRGSEVDGTDYYFLDRDAFRRRIDRGEMLEWAEVYGELYGTPAGPVRDAVDAGRTIVMDVDFQGARQLHDKLPEALFLLIVPPSDAELERRLRGRRTETEDKLQKRLSRARGELAEARASGVFDREIVNDDLSRAVEEVIEAIRIQEPDTE